MKDFQERCYKLVYICVIKLLQTKKLVGHIYLLLIVGVYWEKPFSILIIHVCTIERLICCVVWCVYKIKIIMFLFTLQKLFCVD